jgi:hypothetical protein
MKLGIIFSVGLLATCAAQAQQAASNESETRSAEVKQSTSLIPGNPDAPYEFKNTHLGMSLEEFKRVTSGDLVKRASEHTFLWVPRTKMVPTPFCTDSMRGFEGDPLFDLKKGEVVCNPSPQDANENLLKVAGFRLRQITYSFYNGKLYKISLKISPGLFGAVLDAFSKKYGTPQKLESDSYQNGFGATWRGENFVWKKGEQLIILNEGAGGGPAQIGDDSNGVIVSPAFGPPAAPQQPLDF